MPAILFYLLPVFSIMLISFYVIYFHQSRHLISIFLSIGFLWKIISSILMTFIIVHRYNYGDLPTYYLFAKKISETPHFNYFHYMWGSYLPALLNAAIFKVFPPSLYGLAIITGVTSYLYALFLFAAFRSYLPYSRHLYFLAVIMFLPSLSLQAGYIGKETYLLPILGIIFFFLSIQKKYPLFLLPILIFITALMRPYQGAILITSFSITFLLSTPIEKKWHIMVIIAIFGLFFLIFFGKTIFSHINEIYDMGMKGFLSQAYSGGRAMLTPYSQPWTLFQNFRPFPWESNNIFSFAQSIENSIVFIFFIVSLFSFVYYSGWRCFYDTLNLNQKRFILFSAVYLSIYLILFSYSSNIGDLSRRHVYYYPIILFFGLIDYSHLRLRYLSHYLEKKVK